MEIELSRVVDALPGFVWTALPDGQIDFLNRRWCEYTGLPLDRSCGRGWQAAVHAADLGSLLAGWQDGTAGAPVETKARVRGADGEYRWYLFRAHPSADASGQVVKWCGLSTDIGERKQTEESPQASAAIDGIPGLVAILGPNGYIETVNRRLLEYYGNSIEELRQWATNETIPLEDLPHLADTLSKSIASGVPYEIEHRMRRHDGAYLWFDNRGIPARNDAGQIVRWHVLLTDVEDRKRAEALLAGEKQLLEMVASGHPMPDTLEALCRQVESTASGSYCSIVLVDPGGTKLQETIAPSLAPEFNDAVRGWPLDRLGGPCVMAARDKTQVIMSDVASDARWRSSWRALAQKHGLRSCWSTPMVSQAGKVLGTFALYQREPGTPSPLQLELIAQFTNIASIAIERAQRDAELRRSEARLAEAERELRLTLDSIPTITWRADQVGHVLSGNKRWFDYTGSTPEQIRDRRWQSFVHPDDLAALLEDGKPSTPAGNSAEAEARVRRFDGEYRWFLFRAEAARDESGEIVAWYGTITDIEDKKRAEDALRQSEARLAEAERELQVTIDTIPTLVATYRPDGSRIFVNRTWLDYTGLSLAAAMDAERTSIAHPDDAVRVAEEWQRSLATRTPFKSEMRLRRADGEYRWHSVHRVLARDETGVIVKWYSVAADIEDRKRAEEALRRSEAQFKEAQRELQLTIDSIPAMVATYEPDGTRTFVNQQWQNYTGRTLEEATGPGRHVMRQFHPDESEEVGRAFWNSLATGEPVTLDLRIRRADGEYRWHTHESVPLRDEQGTIIKWYATEVDIEDKKRAESARLLSEARLAGAEGELRLTLDSIPTITWRAGPNGYVQQLNKRWFEYTGTTPEQIRGKRWQSCVHPDDLAQLVDVGRAYVASGTPFDSEARLRRFDGEYRWFLFRPAPVRDESGKIVTWYGTITDIEDRKRAEDALRESEARLSKAERELQHMLDSIPTLIVRGATNGYIEYLNKQWFEYTGTTLETARGFRWQQSLHPDDKDRLVEFGARFVASAEPADCEARLRRFDGVYRWFLFRPAPFRDEAGKFIGWYGTVTDIEDRKQAEEKAGEAERELQRTIDHIPVLVGTYSADGTRLSVNKRALEVTGLSAEDLPDRRWRKAYHPDDVEAVDSLWRDCLASGEPFEREVRTLQADGTYRWHLTRRVPLRDHAGRVIRWYGIGYDIDDQKQAEEELRRSEAFLAKGQEASLTGTFSWHSTTGKFTWSEQLYRIYEFQPGVHVTFELIATRYHPEDRREIEGVAEQARSGVTDFDYAHRLLMADGSIKYVHVVAHGTPDKAGNGLEYFGAVQDVTQRRLAEDALDKVRSELAHVTRVMSLGALTASIAHEVNQPLAGIVTNASTCLRMLAADPPNVEGARETARRTIRDGNRAADVITRLRALFSKKAAAPEIVDLGEAAQEILALVSTDLLRSRINVRAELGHEPLLVNGDRVQLQQVILNLVRNAMDAMSGVYDRPRDLTIRTDREEDLARLAVKDAGVGVDAQTAERLFDAFYTTKSDGMGIGLSVSRSIVESHGGRLWAEPNDGPGATFTFSIPRQAASDADDGTAGAILTRPARGAYDLARNS
jgi:PAS domain S-box-containing protein